MKMCVVGSMSFSLKMSKIIFPLGFNEIFFGIFFQLQFPWHTIWILWILRINKKSLKIYANERNVFYWEVFIQVQILVNNSAHTNFRLAIEWEHEISTVICVGNNSRPALSYFIYITLLICIRVVQSKKNFYSPSLQVLKVICRNEKREIIKNLIFCSVE
jgi:hypothetical protein